MARGAKKKGKFDDLSSEFKDAVAGMSPEDIKKRISEVAIAEHENREAKIKDEDLAEKVAAVKFASEGYREATKANKLKIAYCHDTLASKGKV